MIDFLILSEYGRYLLIEVFIVLIVYIGWVQVRKSKNIIIDLSTQMILIVLLFLSYVYTLYVIYYEYVTSKFNHSPSIGELLLYYSENESVFYPFLLGQALIGFIVLIFYVKIFRHISNNLKAETDKK